MKIYKYESTSECAQRLAAKVSDEICVALQAKARASIAVPGGSTPQAFLRELAQLPLPWSSVDVTTTDERQVPINHARSNAGMLINIFTEKVSLPFFILDHTRPLDELNENYQALFDPLNIAVIGMGEDGHTCSLFPSMSENLFNVNYEKYLEAVTPQDNLEPRITMTMKALAKADNIHLLIHGVQKESVLESALNKSNNTLPIAHVIRQLGDRLSIHIAKNV